ncbi:hypothetical protein [Actinophytocola sp.]|uniref:hypothetical protein n=1 Tax=Actinophytocola sp. TaxID=1872138 RepID=UPI002D762AA1|nr:hypothetical protein [Actinophytocola sp.]HYQ69332.1 hypothetical protein [Actinophytocola sp.]
MTEKVNRPPGGDGRRGLFRRRKREAVPAGPWDGSRNDGEDEAGSAGVREPRHPKPLGPRADAGELPVPKPRFLVTLPDPRR